MTHKRTATACAWQPVRVVLGLSKTMPTATSGLPWLGKTSSNIILREMAVSQDALCAFEMIGNLVSQTLQTTATSRARMDGFSHPRQLQNALRTRSATTGTALCHEASLKQGKTRSQWSEHADTRLHARVHARVQLRARVRSWRADLTLWRPAEITVVCK